MKHFYIAKRRNWWRSFLSLTLLISGGVLVSKAQSELQSINILPSSLELYSGDYYELQLETTPADAEAFVDWESSDSDVLSIADSYIWANFDIMEPTKVTVTARSYEPELEATCVVTVLPAKFNFYEKAIVLPTGWSYQPQFLTSGNYDSNNLWLGWSVEGDDIVYINHNNLITSTGKAGHCILTATLEGESHSLEVTVADGIQNGTIQHNWNIGDFDDMNDTYFVNINGLTDNYLQAQIANHSGTKLFWNSANENIATVNDYGLVSIKQEVPVTFSVITSNNNLAIYDYIPSNVQVMDEAFLLNYPRFNTKITNLNFGWGNDASISLTDGSFATISYEGQDPQNARISIIHNNEEWPPYQGEIALTEVVGIGKTGFYTVTLPLGTVVNEYGAINPTQRWEFNILETKSLKYTPSVAEGNVKPYQVSPLYLAIEKGYYISDVNSELERPYVLDSDNNKLEQLPDIGVNWDENGNSSLEVNLGYLEPGTYTLVIPEGLIVQGQYDTDNRSLSTEFRLTYTVEEGMAYGKIVSPLGDAQPSITKVEIEFDTEISIVPNTGLSVGYYQEGKNEWLEASASVEGKILTLGFDWENMPARCGFNFTIPGGFLSDKTGEDFNRQQNFYYNIRPQIDVNYSATPESGTEINLGQLSQIKLYFGDDFYGMYENSGALTPYIYTEDGTTIPLTLENQGLSIVDYIYLKINASAVDQGLIKIVVPENSFVVYNDNGEYLNSSIELTYTISGNVINTPITVVEPENYEENMKLEHLSNIRLSFGETKVTYYNTENQWCNLTYIDLEGNINQEGPWVGIQTDPDNDGSESDSQYGSMVDIYCYNANPGSYVIEIPAGFFVDTYGNFNQKLTYSFSVTGPEIPAYTLTPEVGEIPSGILDSFVLNFGNLDLWLDPDYAKEVVTISNGKEKLALASVTRPIIVEEYDDYKYEYEDNTKVIFTLAEPQTEPGTYTITIPGGLISLTGDGWNYRYNEDIQFEYIIGYDIFNDYKSQIITDSSNKPIGAIVTFNTIEAVTYNGDNTDPVIAKSATNSYEVETSLSNNVMTLYFTEFKAGSYSITIPEGYIFIGSKYINGKITLSMIIEPDGPTSGISGVEADANGLYNVYSMSGVNIISTKDIQKVKDLDNGIYIINGKKVMIRK